MFTEAILKAWDPVHLPICGWYLDCPLKRPPSSEVTLRESLEPALKGQIASTPKIQAKDSVKCSFRMSQVQNGIAPLL
jgi:hypothetical protein